MAAYKALGGSFTGSLIVDPRHKRELKDPAVIPGGDRTRRIRDVVEAVLSDIIFYRALTDYLRLVLAEAK